MPEIAEGYRAAMTLRRAALNKTITSVTTIEDDLVFVGGTAGFKDTILGRKVTAVRAIRETLLYDHGQQEIDPISSRHVRICTYTRYIKSGSC